MREHYRRIADTAQASLATLQQKMMMHNSTHGTSGQHLSKTFRDFMQQTRLADAAERQSERDFAQTVAAQQATPLHVPAHPAAAAAPVAAPAVVAVAAVVQAPSAPAGTDSLPDVMARLDALGEDKEAKKKLMAQLPEALNMAVREELKRRKDERERKAREADAELEDLL